jgi:hypothetical protein
MLISSRSAPIPPASRLTASPAPASPTTRPPGMVQRLVRTGEAAGHSRFRSCEPRRAVSPPASTASMMRAFPRPRSPRTGRPPTSPTEPALFPGRAPAPGRSPATPSRRPASPLRPNTGATAGSSPPRRCPQAAVFTAADGGGGRPAAARSGQRGPHSAERDGREAMDSLGPAHLQVLRLAHGEGLTQSQIAARLGLPLGTEDAHVPRAAGAAGRADRAGFRCRSVTRTWAWRIPTSPGGCSAPSTRTRPELPGASAVLRRVPGSCD